MPMSDCGNCAEWVDVLDEPDFGKWGFCNYRPSVTYVSEITEDVCDSCGQVVCKTVPCVKLMPLPDVGEACDGWKQRGGGNAGE